MNSFLGGASVRGSTAVAESLAEGFPAQASAVFGPDVGHVLGPGRGLELGLELGPGSGPGLGPGPVSGVAEAVASAASGPVSVSGSPPVSALVVAAVLICAGSAAWLLAGQDRGARRAGALLALGPSATRPRPTAHRLRGLLRHCMRLGARRESWCVVAGVVAAVLGDSLLPLLIGAAGVPLVRRAARRAQAQRAQAQRVDAVIALCALLAGEVRAGGQPGGALLAAARDSDAVAGARAAVLAAARFGGDVPAALGRAAGASGAEGLLGLAACWQVAVDRGAGLAAGLDRLDAALRAQRDQRADLRAQLAGSRSTAVLLAALPLLGLLLGSALGAAPLRVLLHSAAGFGCLLVGGVLEGVGLWWALRIVRGGEGG